MHRQRIIPEARGPHLGRHRMIIRFAARARPVYRGRRGKRTCQREGSQLMQSAIGSGHDSEIGSALIVEDNPEFLLHLTRAVESIRRNWDIAAAQTAADAIRLAGRGDRQLDLALIDIGLPDRSGVDVVREVTALHPNAAVLVVSVISAEEAVLAAIKAGARGYLLKDGSISAIRHGIEQVLSDQYPISPALARYLFRLAKGADAANIPEITGRELDVLVGLSEGLTYQEIAETLDLSISTVRTHIQKIYRKLNAKTGSEAVAVAKTRMLI